MSLKRMAAALAITMLGASGSAAVAQSPTQPSAVPPEGVPWVLAELALDGELSDVPEGSAATLLLADGQASGNAGCNSYSGLYTLRGASLSFGPLMSTAMLCAEAAMAIETAYLGHLSEVASFELGRNDLTLADAGGQPLLVFDEAEPSAIAGDWVVTSYRNGAGDQVTPVAGSLLTAGFGSDGALVGSSGCNHYTTTYTIDGGDLDIGAPGSTRMACASPELQTQESDLLAALAASGRWSQSGTELELIDASGLGSETTVRLTRAIEASYVGSWVVTGYDQGNASLTTPIEGTMLTATFSVDGELEGNAGCNLYSGPYTVDGDAMTVGPLASTAMSCSDAVDQQEQSFQAALNGVTGWTGDASGISLHDGQGVTKVTLAPAP